MEGLFSKSKSISMHEVVGKHKVYVRVQKTSGICQSIENLPSPFFISLPISAERCVKNLELGVNCRRKQSWGANRHVVSWPVATEEQIPDTNVIRAILPWRETTWLCLAL